MSTLKLLIYAAMGIGCFLAVIGLTTRRQWQAKHDRERARAQGTVVDHAQKTSGSRGRPICHPVISFTVDGSEQRSEWRTLAVAEEWPVGRSVEVLYDPDHPENIHLAEEELQSPPDTILRTGIIWLVCALVASVALNALSGIPAVSRLLDGGTPAELVESGDASGPFRVIAEQNGFATLSGYSGGDAVLEVPTLVDGHIVTAISPGALSGNRFLREVVLPGSITKVPMYAFAGCTALTGVRLKEGVQTVESHAFDMCPSLRDVTLPASLTGIAKDAAPADSGIVFHVAKGSEAQRLCAEHGFAVEVIDPDDIV